MIDFQKHLKLRTAIDVLSVVFFGYVVVIFPVLIKCCKTYLDNEKIFSHLLYYDAFSMAPVSFVWLIMRFTKIDGKTAVQHKKVQFGLLLVFGLTVFLGLIS